MSAAPVNPVAAEHARIVAYWTPARRAAAIPRDLYKDASGQGYIRGPNGTLVPYGRVVADSSKPAPAAGKPGSGDTTPPAVSNFDPASGATIGASYTFKATVTDASGIRSVSFYVQKSGYAAQKFSASGTGGDTYAYSLQGFTDGTWSWWVVAKDKAGNTTTTNPVPFSVSTSGGGGGGGGGGDTVVTNANWGSRSGDLRTAAGRLYFEMPSNPKQTRWTGYVCSGTVVVDETSGRSIILTAGHCVYDDSHKAFARNVMFFPDQADTTGSGTDLTCSNDPLGCWTPSFGVVDVDYTTRTFPDNDQWDYAYYVVSDTGHHSSGYTSDVSSVLDAATTPMTVSFADPAVNTPDSSDYTYALGYSYSEDPNFMYCAEDMTTTGSVNWWLPSCGLSGGSSGGPWVQGMTVSGGATTTEGQVMSVNSWGYTNSPGMAGPKLNDGSSTAACVFSRAKAEALSPAPSSRGYAETCP